MLIRGFFLGTALLITLPLLQGCGLKVRSLVGKSKSTFGTNDPRALADASYGQSSAIVNTAVERGMGIPRTPMIIGGKLFVIDQVGQRVLIWNTPFNAASSPADVILGQTESYFTFPNGTLDYFRRNSTLKDIPNAWGFNTPSGLCSDGTKLIVADRSNHRVLIWNQIPTTNGKSADVVLGQPDFTSNTPDNGGVSAKSLNSPWDVAYVSGRLYVLDGQNNRVLFWNSIPTAHFTHADGVLGQPDFTTVTPNTGGTRTASTLYNPRGIVAYSGHLLVADYSNHRVLAWNSTTPASLAPADTVLGQTTFANGAVNGGVLSAHSFSGPATLSTVGTSLYVSDFGNSRILIWDSMPASGSVDADRVIGQPNFTSNTVNNGGVSATSLSAPLGAATDGARLYVADSNNQRLLIYHSIPSANTPAADSVWGQLALNQNLQMDAVAPETSIRYPFHFSFDGIYHWAADSRHHRVLRWPLGKTPFDGVGPDRVLGQSNLTGVQTAVTATGMNTPTSVASNGTKFYAADYANNRILIWNTYPITTGAAADAVLGQSLLTTGTANLGGVSNHSLKLPYHLSISGGKLFVADAGNHRVLIWNSLPSTSNAIADVVLGQPNFTSNTANIGGISAATFDTPSCVYVLSGKLFVCDKLNHRILVWNTIPTGNQTPADYVIGQPDFTSNAVDAGQWTANANGLNQPMSVAYAGNRFYVSDYGNHRVLIWNHLPLAGEAANQVLGQLDFTSALPNSQGLSGRSLFGPVGLWLQGMDLWVSDNINNRFLRFSATD